MPWGEELRYDWQNTNDAKAGDAKAGDAKAGDVKVQKVTA